MRGPDPMPEERWFVAVDGVVSGPYETSTLHRMASEGTLRPDCAVVPVGSTEWVAVEVAEHRLGLRRDAWGRYVAPHGLPPGAPLPPPSNAPVPAWATAGAPGPASGSPAAGDGEAPLASYGRRVVAWVVDAIIQTAIAVPLMLAAGLRLPDDRFDLEQLSDVPTAAYLVLAAVWVGYAGCFVGARGQTPGKMLARIEVIAEEGGPLGFRRAFARSAASFVLQNVCTPFGLVDLVWPLWDRRRQALHDKASRSLVVDRR